jgi:hypothetical protein
MALPASGQISMGDIRVELGVPTQSPFSLDTARAGGYVTLNTNSPSLPPSTGQISLSDWYEYCQNCDTYNFSYASTQVTACLNNDPITVVSNTIPIGVGSLLNYPDGSQAPCDYYFSDGTNWYYVTCTAFETSVVTSTGACSSPTYGLYTADEYYCVDGECVFSMSDVVVAFLLPFTPNYGKFYGLQAGGFYYSLSEEVFSGPGAICNKTPNFSDCASWCFV